MSMVHIQILISENMPPSPPLDGRVISPVILGVVPFGKPIFVFVAVPVRQQAELFEVVET